MVNLGQARLVGGIAGIFLFLSILPEVGRILIIIGFIALLQALKWVADSVNTPAIYKNALIGTIVGILGNVVGYVVGGVSILLALSGNFGIGEEDFVSLIFGLIIVLGIVWVLLIVSSIFLRRSLNMTAESLGIRLFRTAALLLLIGAFLTIILIGFILILVAYIILAIAFFQIKAEKARPPPPPPPP